MRTLQARASRLRSRCVGGHASYRVQGEGKRCGVRLRWKAQVGGQPEFRRTGDAMRPTGELLFWEHARREVARPAIGEEILQPEPAVVYGECSTREPREREAVLGKKLWTPVDVDIIALRLPGRLFPS